MRCLPLAVAITCSTLASAHADEPAFVTGRPGNTESPISVPPSYWQIETEVVSYAYDREDGVQASATSAGAVDLRYGLAHGWDGEVIFKPYLSDTVRVGGVSDTQSGFGDVTVRTRRTLIGEDGNGPAVAVIGFIELPTSQHHLDDDKVEGGAILTAATALTKRLSLTGTVEAASASNGGGRQGEFSGGANLSYALTDKFGCYGELFAVRDEHDTRTAATFDFGATYLTGPTTQLDAGANLGVTRAADDVDVFVGWSHRF